MSRAWCAKVTRTPTPPQWKAAAKVLHAVAGANGAGGGKLIAETSSREQYAPTQAFYRSCGFIEEARIRDYYSPGEDILYFTKPLG